MSGKKGRGRRGGSQSPRSGSDSGYASGSSTDYSDNNASTQNNRGGNGNFQNGRRGTGGNTQNGHNGNGGYTQNGYISNNQGNGRLNPWNDNNRNNQNDNNFTPRNNNRGRCNRCNQFGHLEYQCSLMADVVNDGPSRGKQSNKPAPKETIKYCEFCNIGYQHTSDECRDNEALLKVRYSKLHCLLCKRKGHMESDCRDPNFQPKENAATKLKRHFAEDPNKRFKWQGNFALTAAQQQRQEWEQFKRSQIEQGVFIDINDQNRVEAYLAELETHDRSPPLNGQAARSQATTLNFNPAQVFPGLANIIPQGNNSNNNDAALGMKLRQAGVNQEDILRLEQFELDNKQKEKLLTQKRIIQKCNESRYPAACVNQQLLYLEGAILERQLLTRTRMDEVKNCIRQSATFMRDPRAMQALFDRKRPQCLDCGKQGKIFDRYFNIIDPRTTTRELMLIEDSNDWGIFIGFECGCKDKTHCGVRRVRSELVPHYDFVDLPPSLFYDFVDEV